MPLYEYKCARCGAVFEKLQHFSDEPLKTHDQCGGDVERLISPPAFQFKGSGWYITDYARKSGSNGSKAKESKDTKETAKPAESKSSEPSKPSSVSDTKP